LDIFAQRAKTDEGKLQVALAQYKYLLPRLSGLGLALSRLGGGIGTRGPGETQLETDRRHIRRRIDQLEGELKELHRVRAQQRRLREKNEMPMAALVGYTNAGKSTLLNALTGESLPANDRLFDTLDNTTRRMTVSPGNEILLTDTVGFIRRLPHHLIEAFAATLDELKFADMVLKVSDLSSPQLQMQSETVDRLIHDLCPPDVPVIEVYNKRDRVSADILPSGERTVCISAKTGEGLETLRSMMKAELERSKKRVKILLPYSESGLLDRIHKEAAVEELNYAEGGAEIRLVCGQKLYGVLRKFEV
jgi:GTP-binding protein HflX